MHQYQDLFKKQNGRCASCKIKQEDHFGVLKGNRGAEPTLHGKGAIFVVDHDHETGRVRALLCQGCNLAIGNSGEDSKKLRKMADYVDLWKRKLPGQEEV